MQLRKIHPGMWFPTTDEIGNCVPPEQCVIARRDSSHGFIIFCEPTTIGEAKSMVVNLSKLGVFQKKFQIIPSSTCVNCRRETVLQGKNICPACNDLVVRSQKSFVA